MKERLIGASLLVVLIVLVVPEMLSGPRQPSAPPQRVGLPAPTRSVSVDLATSQATAEPDLSESASAAPPAAASGASEPAASAGGASLANPPAAGSEGFSDATPGASSVPESAPTVTTLKAQEPAGYPLESAPSPPKSAVGGSRLGVEGDAGGAQTGRRGWAVQLGSFASRANAARLVHQMQARGGSSLYVSASGSGRSARYRVRVGPLADRAAAERALLKLRAAGHAATLVTPPS